MKKVCVIIFFYNIPLVPDDELELFHFQKLEQEVLGDKVYTLGDIRTDHDDIIDLKCREALGVQSLKALKNDPKDLFLENQGKGHSNPTKLEKTKLNTTFENLAKSDIDLRHVEKSPLTLQNSNYNMQHHTPPVSASSIHRTLIDLTPNSMASKTKSRSNSALVSRINKDLNKENALNLETIPTVQESRNEDRKSGSVTSIEDGLPSKTSNVIPQNVPSVRN